MAINRRGFSLPEMLMTLAGFIVVTVAVLAAFNVGIAGSGDAENMRTALYLAQARMEAVRNMKFDAIGSSPEADDRVFTGFRVRVDVTGTDPKTISVVVTWSVKGSPVSCTLTTLRSNNLFV